MLVEVCGDQVEGQVALFGVEYRMRSNDVARWGREVPHPECDFGRVKDAVDLQKSLDRAEALWVRANEFCHAAQTLFGGHGQGKLTSSLLLLGYCAELIAKKRLLERGVPEDSLSRQPYSHNILSMWQSDPKLWEEAEIVYLESGGRDDFLIHMCVLDYLCGGRSKYSIRYNEYRAHYPEARYLLPVFLEIIKRERMRQEAWAPTLSVQEYDSRKFR
ncbi:hypothetical protein JMK10_02935 [Rhodovulum sulfidophilum]|uniref:hypothetical protein n=1 Tax=Rhodovulum sulfidophilum TaxID=35806 RepID=UPI0019249107|nr:hypothetical protein [Rhodovulum sulfidophilum]MBL3576245.1 hypothetical protein [Rhodovulum sulfidophilum]MCE8432706.1 hypothetical protein [Rhodovulum sulfidophilum]MCF4115789.1 hypothetical protein [Rhodovulum sulfidophilum]